MEKIDHKLHGTSEAKPKRENGEKVMTSLILERNSMMMHAYYEIPNYEDNVKNFFSVPQNVGRILIFNVKNLVFELPGLHLELVTQYSIFSNKNNYTVKCDKESEGWINMWSVCLSNKEILEINTSEPGQILSKFVSYSGNLTKFIANQHCEEISIPDFIDNAATCAINKINESISPYNTLGYEKGDNKIKEILIDSDFNSNLSEKIKDLASKASKGIRENNFNHFHCPYGEEIGQLEEIMSKFDIVRNKSHLEKELSNNIAKSKRNKI